MTQSNVHPKILEACNKVTGKRPKTVINHILKYGFITTEELKNTYGYDHPPRAVRDVREAGVPLETYRVTSNETGRKIAAYRFGNPDDIRHGQINGRSAFSKEFKQQLIEKYGERDTVTNEPWQERYLQIDHRIPYEVGGDNDDSREVEDYMLLHASTQRKKSWSCEQCRNFKEYRDPANCKGCYWAAPESYTHVALVEARLLHTEWRGSDCKIFDDFSAKAKEEGKSVQELLKKCIEELL